ncbi:unnamed protein product [Camellia sinensis]
METNKKNEVPATRLEVWMAGYSKDNKPSTNKVVEVMTQMKEFGAQSNATNEEIITRVLELERPSRVRTYGLGLSSTDVFGGGYRQSQEQTYIIQTQVQEQLNQYKAQMEMQMKEMMDAMLNQQKVQMEMQNTIQAQQAQIEQLKSQQAMGGPVAPTTTHVHSQQQSHAYTSSFNCHRSSEEFTYQRKKRRRRRKRSRYDKLNERMTIESTELKGHCPGTPLVLYINGNGGFLERMKGTRVDVIRLDWTVDMADGKKHLGNGISIQGNVEPACLFSPLPALTDEIERFVMRTKTWE